MHRLFTRATVAGAVILVLGLSACSLFDDERVTRVPFIAEVSVIEAPEPIAASEPLEVRLAGPLGPDSCWRFDRIQAQRSGSRLDVRVHGEHWVNEVCLPTATSFDEVVTVEPPFQDTFTVVAHQPDGSRLERTFAVASD